MDRRPPGPSAAGRCVAASVAAAVLVFGVIAACSDDDDPKGPTATVGTAPPTTEPAPTTTTIEDVEAEVEAAYLEAFAAYYDAISSPTDGNGLRERLRGPSLERAESYVERLRAAGREAEFPDGVRPSAVVESVEISGTKATVSSCEVDNVRIVQLPERTAIDADVVSRRSTSVLELDGDVWFLTNVTIERRWDGAEGCGR